MTLTGVCGTQIGIVSAAQPSDTPNAVSPFGDPSLIFRTPFGDASMTVLCGFPGLSGQGMRPPCGLSSLRPASDIFQGCPKLRWMRAIGAAAAGLLSHSEIEWEQDNARECRVVGPIAACAFLLRQASFPTKNTGPCSERRINQRKERPV